MADSIHEALTLMRVTLGRRRDAART
jgi:hypothetical protein